MTLHIAHMVNPVNAAPGSDLTVAQPVTFESMRRARDLAEGVDVSLFTCQYPEDRAVLPEGFTATDDLDRSVLDVGSFSKPRKLPLIADIISRLYHATDAEILVYTNVDIALMPYFYTTIAAMVEDGHDAMVINRRTISDHHRDPDGLPLMYAEAGASHPGHDCFVFRRDAVPAFDLGEVCIGINWVGRVLIWNLCLQGHRFSEFTDRHLTFHIGNDKAWKNPDFDDYREFNRQQSASVLDRLSKRFGPFPMDHAIQPYLPNQPQEDSGLSGLLGRLTGRR